MSLIRRDAVPRPGCLVRRRAPFPTGILVAALVDVSVALKTAPAPMAGHLRDLGNLPAYLEKSRHTVMAQIVEV